MPEPRSAEAWVKCECQKYYHPPDWPSCEPCLLIKAGLNLKGRHDSCDHEGLGPRMYEESDVLAALVRATQETAALQTALTEAQAHNETGATQFQQSERFKAERERGTHRDAHA